MKKKGKKSREAILRRMCEGLIFLAWQIAPFYAAGLAGFIVHIIVFKICCRRTREELIMMMPEGPHI